MVNIIEIRHYINISTAGFTSHLLVRIECIVMIHCRSKQRNRGYPDLDRVNHEYCRNDIAFKICCESVEVKKGFHLMLSDTSSMRVEIVRPAPYCSARSNLLALIGDDMLHMVLSCLNFFDFGILDVAITNREYRQQWLGVLSKSTSKVFDKFVNCDSSLQWLIRRRVNSSNIDFWGDKDRITDYIFAAIQIAGLLSINLADCCQITSRAICVIAKGCPSIENIVLEGCIHVDDLGISALAQNCVNLISINFSKCHRITDVGVKAIASSCRSLEHVNLSDCFGISYRGLENISMGCHKLKSFKFDRINYPSSLIHTISEHSFLLEEINFCDTRWSGFYPVEIVINITHLVTNCKLLRILDLNDSHYCFDGSLVVIGNECSLLESLDIRNNSNITCIGILAIANGCKNLLSINLNECPGIDDSCLFILANGCVKLTKISLIKNDRITDTGLIRLMLQCPYLSSIDVSLCFYISDRGVNAMNNCSQLTHVNLSGCHLSLGTVSTFGLYCPFLTSIELSSRCSVFDDDILLIAKGCCKLRKIILDTCCNITDLSLKSIAASCKDLMLIHLNGCWLLTDLGFIALSLGCSKLDDVNLFDCFLITDASILSLMTHCPLLRKLDVTNCLRVSADLLNDYPLSTSQYSRVMRTQLERTTN